MKPDATTELVDFIVHKSFYPVLMVNRGGPNKAIIEHVQDATRAEIVRYRNCRSVQDVIASFKRDVQERSASPIYSELKLLHLPVLDDFKDEFEEKARQLGYELETLLTLLDTFRHGEMIVDHERISQRAYAIWERAGRPDDAHEEHWEQACRKIKAEPAEMIPHRASVHSLNTKTATARNSTRIVRKS